ncbi:MAG: methyl-accepting chemotaxis protein, partial [Pseudomonas sp.]
NQTVTQMDETTQQNAALVEEATAAARAMEQQAQQLAEAVASFELEEQATPEQASAPQPRRTAFAKSVTPSPVVAATKPARTRRPPKSQSEPALADGDWQEF